MLRMSQSRAAVLLAAFFLNACANAENSAHPRGSAQGSGIVELLESTKYGLAIVIHPYSCTLTVDDTRALTVLQEDGLPVTVAFVGTEADSVAVNEIAHDLQLTVPWRFLSHTAFNSFAQPVGSGTPVMFLVRRGQPVAILNAFNFRDMLDVVASIYRRSDAERLSWSGT